MPDNNHRRVSQLMPWVGDEEIAGIAEVIHDNWITEGPKSAEFSRRLNALMGVEYGVFAPNGTLALALALMALGIGYGDEVLVPDTTFIGSATAVMMVGATPSFVEVQQANFQIDMTDAERLLTPRTKAIMPVHLFGMCCDMDAVLAFAKKHNLLVIEDAAQCVGVTYRGRHAGTMGDVGCFSFFADKTVTTAEGGYVVCKDEAVYEKLRLLRNQGRMDRGSFIHPAVGFNFRITDMQAAMGLAQMDKLEEIKRRKLENLEHYIEGLDGIDEVRLIELQEGSSYVPFRAILMSERAEEMKDYLNAHNVETRGFFWPLHRQPCFERLDKKNGGPLDLSDDHYPAAIYGIEHGLCLPIHTFLTPDDIAHVCNTIREFHRR